MEFEVPIGYDEPPSLLHFSKIFRTDVDEMLHGEQCGTIFNQILEKVLQINQQQLNRLLVECCVREHGPEPNEKPKQMKCAVDVGHRRVWMSVQYLGVLWTLRLVEQLWPKHDIKVRNETGGDVGDIHFFALCG